MKSVLKMSELHEQICVCQGHVFVSFLEQKMPTDFLTGRVHACVHIHACKPLASCSNVRMQVVHQI